MTSHRHPPHLQDMLESEPNPMPIIVTLDVMLARRKMRSKELAERVGITEQNLSLLKSGKVKGVRFDTLAAICDALQCQPGDLIEFVPDPVSSVEPSERSC
jgi:putative transcriptional regulator